MTRVIGGLARGRRLAVPVRGTRPTSDRVRESMFSSLDADLVAGGSAWADVVALDLYAGSGALGLEALSRGARAAYLVESDRAAARTLTANAEAVGLPGAQVLVRRAEALASAPAPDPGASLVLLDPPYDVDAAAIRALLGRLAASGWIVDGARVVVERPSRDAEDPLPAGWASSPRRRFGDTCLWYGRVVGERRSREEGA